MALCTLSAPHNFRQHVSRRESDVVDPFILFLKGPFNSQIIFPKQFHSLELKIKRFTPDCRATYKCFFRNGFLFYYLILRSILGCLGMVLTTIN